MSTPTSPKIQRGYFGTFGLGPMGTVAITVPLFRNCTVEGPAGATPVLFVSTVAVSVTFPPEATVEDVDIATVAVGAFTIITDIVCEGLVALALPGLKLLSPE